MIKIPVQSILLHRKSTDVNLINGVWVTYQIGALLIPPNYTVPGNGSFIPNKVNRFLS